MKTDIEIAHSVEMKSIKSIAKNIGLSEDNLEMYGEYKAKIKLEAIEKFKKQRGELVLVSAITPTPAGEGKTTTSIGLSMALNRMGKKSIVTLREPSLGPLFGMKGGATGGGYAQVLPMEDINLHFTGDMHAVTTAHNLISAVVDNHIFRRKEPLIDPRRIMWNRVMDMNDRALRNMVIGLGGRKNGVPRETSFQITASSEIMAILCLAESYPELKDMISNILIGLTYNGEPVYVKDLKIEGAVTALLKDAIKPNLVQTTENTPAFVHGGPFANIAQGTCSVLSMKLALALSDFVVTEAGFGFDLGAEKFFDIVARKSGLKPRVVVLVATVRALKMHGGKDIKEITEPDPDAVEKGLPNLEKHIENIKKFGLPPVVAINRFPSDTREELNVIKAFCSSKGVDVSISEVHSKGGEGAIELAEMVSEEVKKQREYTPLYSLELPVKEKIEVVSREIYGSKAVDFTRDGKTDLKLIKKLGLENLPVCIAKTQKSLSDNPKLLGRPKDFLVTVRRITISSGAGFLVPITGDILLMPGLPHKPVAETVDIDNQGNIKGLF
ncbi:MAG TPA: formate--tetrahydrofolate ligase [candidate division WOR-3 bacterium]|uniref:Formate--tetrahydrofolate ligase n=1 Tax=candidate division WOR-3 bacterium TaxID=2052148 RepID=A0A7C0VA67_UNCW3|nr:formate--tetrahydrofolate ligase [candidate division WOR-3 bacterium]